MLVEHYRNGLIEECHDGLVLTLSKGDNSDYPYFLRSCAKPLQASLLIDYELDKIYNMTSGEIALCCASHAGEKCHSEIAKVLLNKFGLEYDMLHCGIHQPLSKTRQFELKTEGKEPSYFENNCVGKHLMFLALSKLNGWDMDSYYNPEHPLQKLVKNKINSLCEVKDNYPQTTDGCGVPILSMPLKNMLIGFKNLFSNNKYEKIKKAFLENQYIIGGQDRLDTEIMQNSNGLIAKVGAGGLCIVFNPVINDALIVKIHDCDMKTRRLVVFEALNKLNWTQYHCSKEIKTLHGEIVGEIKISLPF